MPLEGIIFDFDGTLAELRIDFGQLRREVEAMARARGWSDPWPAQGYLLEQVEAVGRGLRDGFVAEAMAHIQAAELAAAGEGALFPFTRGLLGQARERGLRVGIISRNCGQAIRRVFPDLEEFCPVFLPREAVSRPKPHPEHLAAALARLGLKPAQAAAVGDHPLDVSAALAAGCRAVGVASGRISAEDLAAAGAHLVLPHAGDLLAALAPELRVRA